MVLQQGSGGKKAHRACAIVRDMQETVGSVFSMFHGVGQHQCLYDLVHNRYESAHQAKNK
jgi:hypothetical protein